MRAKVFVPGHITGFFEIVERGDDLKTGSRGCGVVIDKGVLTEVKVKEGQVGELSIETSINGKPFDCPVTKTALKNVLDTIEGGHKIEVFHELDVPMSQGFGASGAGTLGAVIGINEVLDLKMKLERCGKAAHVAEVRNKTGLGDVTAQLAGGIVIRKEPGAPGIAEVDRVGGSSGSGSRSRYGSMSHVVSFIVGEEIKTASVITNQGIKKRINAIGNTCLNEIMKSPTQENFLRLSKVFAYRSKLMSKEVDSAIKELEKRGMESSMIMLGNSVFTLADGPERAMELLGLLEHLGYPGIVSKIDYNGPEILEVRQRSRR